jgi:hypothetical protein
MKFICYFATITAFLFYECYFSFIFIHRWLFSSLLGPGLFFSFLILYTIGRTPWTGDQPVAMQLPTYRTTQTEDKRTQTSMPWWDSNPRSQLSSERRQFMPQTARPLWWAYKYYYRTKIPNVRDGRKSDCKPFNRTWHDAATYDKASLLKLRLSITRPLSLFPPLFLGLKFKVMIN